MLVAGLSRRYNGGVARPGFGPDPGSGSTRDSTEAVTEAVMKRGIAIAIGLLVVLGHEAAAQKDTSVSRPASSGVYTAEQARIGEEAYAGMCTGCHTPASHTGDVFASAWSGRPVSELYGFIRAAMPKTDPGSLSAEEYAAIVAYILKLNGMPAGKRPLPADSAALDRILIDLKKGS